MLASNKIVMSRYWPIISPISLIIFVNLSVAGTLCSTQAFLVNGAYGPESNHCDYYENIDRATKSLNLGAQDGSGLLAPCITTFSANGPTTHYADMEYVRNHGDRKNDSTCMEPRSSDSRFFSGGKLPDHGANFETIKKEMAEKLKSDYSKSPVLLYFTDHGGKNENNESTVAMWNGEELTQAQVRELVSLVPKDRKVVVVNDQCFGGGIVSGLFSDHMEIPSNVCGFSMAQGTEYAFSGGGFMRGAERLYQSKDAKWDKDGNHFYSYREIYSEVLEEDQTSSTPESTVDIFLRNYYSSNPMLENQMLTDLAETCIFDSLESSPFNQMASTVNNVLVKDEIPRQKRELKACLKDRVDGENVTLKKLLSEMNTSESVVRQYDKTIEDIDTRIAEANLNLMNKWFEAGCPQGQGMQDQLACPPIPGVSNADRYYADNNDLVSLSNFQADKTKFCNENSSFSCCHSTIFDRSASLGQIYCSTAIKTIQTDYDNLSIQWDNIVKKVNSISNTKASAASIGIPLELNGDVNELVRLKNDKKSAEKRFTNGNIKYSQLRRCAKAAQNLAGLMAIEKKGDIRSLSKVLSIQDCEESPFAPVNHR